MIGGGLCASTITEKNVSNGGRLATASTRFRSDQVHVTNAALVHNVARDGQVGRGYVGGDNALEMLRQPNRDPSDAAAEFEAGYPGLFPVARQRRQHGIDWFLAAVEELSLVLLQVLSAVPVRGEDRPMRVLFAQMGELALDPLDHFPQPRLRDVDVDGNRRPIEGLQGRGRHRRRSLLLTKKYRNTALISVLGSARTDKMVRWAKQAIFPQQTQECGARGARDYRLAVCIPTL